MLPLTYLHDDPAVLAARTEGVGNLDAGAVAALVAECDDVAVALAQVPRGGGAVNLDDCMRTFLAVDVSQTLDAVADEVGAERAAAAVNA